MRSQRPPSDPALAGRPWTVPEAGSVTMFTTTWCGYCRRLKNAVQGAGIGYDEVDIDQDETAARFVMAANNGDRTVPTLLFPDGSTATNPSLAEVRARLA